MTIREQLERQLRFRRIASGVIYMLLFASLVLGLIEGPIAFIAMLLFSGCVAAILISRLRNGLQCPSCQHNFAYLVSPYVSGYFRPFDYLELCPHCGIDLDKQASEAKFFRYEGVGSYQPNNYAPEPKSMVLEAEDSVVIPKIRQTTIRESLSRKHGKLRLPALIILFTGLSILVLSNGAFYGKVVFFVCLAAAYVFIFMILGGIKCPNCNGSLGYLIRRPGWNKSRNIRFCPHCGLDLDNKAHELFRP